MPKSTLTPKQQAFVQFYAFDRNATNASKRAGYSEKTARQMASENLSKPAIQAAISVQEAITAHELGLTREKVLRDMLDAIEHRITRKDGAVRWVSDTAILLNRVTKT